MPNRLWRIAKRLIKFVIWLDLIFITSVACFYGFIHSFDCDDGLQTGAICDYSFTAFYLGVFTFLGLTLWGIWQVSRSLRQRL